MSMEVREPSAKYLVKPGYKQTEVGVVPQNWSVTQLGQLADFITSGSRGWAQFYSESGALFIRSQNVRDGRLCFDDLQHVSPPAGAEGNRTRVERHDLLITITGNSVGNVALVEESFGEAYISQHVGLVRLREPATGAYINRYLSPNSPGNSQIAGSQSGQSKPGLNLQNLRDFRIAFPPTFREVHAISEALGDMDALLGGLERLIAKKRDLKQAAMQQLLTGQTRLPGFSGEWEVMQLGDVVEIRKGQLITSDTKGIGDIPVIAGGKQPAYYHDVANRQGRTITISASGASAGYVALYNTPIFASDCSTISEGQSYSIDFILHQLLLKQQLIYKAQTGGAQPHIHPVDVMPIEINVPPLPEQSAIADVLSDMDAELATLEARRDKTRALKQAMMQELLTGRTRLI
jgi:type I restriction enzyme S subunit